MACEQHGLNMRNDSYGHLLFQEGVHHFLLFSFLITHKERFASFVRHSDGTG